MAKQTITRALARDLPPPPEGAAKVRIFDDKLPGFILERRRKGRRSTCATPTTAGGAGRSSSDGTVT